LLQQSGYAVCSSLSHCLFRYLVGFTKGKEPETKGEEQGDFEACVIR